MRPRLRRVLAGLLTVGAAAGLLALRLYVLPSVQRDRRASGVCAAAMALLASRSEAPVAPTPPDPFVARPLPPSPKAVLLTGEPSGLPLLSESRVSLQEAASRRIDPDEGARTFARYGYEDGYGREWGDEGSVGAFADVYAFDSPGNALAFQAYATRNACRFAAAAFGVDGVDGAVGMRLRYQDGREEDQVSFVRGTRRYRVGYRYFEASPTSYTEAARFARVQNRIAR